MSAPRIKQSVCESEWQEMARLKRCIDGNPTSCTVDELESFTDLFVRTIKQNNLALIDG